MASRRHEGRRRPRPGNRLVVCSHRGPFVFEATSDGLKARRGSGGLIGAIGPVLERFGGTWIAAAMSDGDRTVARESGPGRDEGGFTLRLLDLPPEVHELHYGKVSNEVLWFLFHYLFQTPTEPRFDGSFAASWDAYRRVNDLFAAAALEAERADAWLVEDYQLMLVGRAMRARTRVRRPLVYFHHTPWCEPDYFSILPRAVAVEILEGLLAYDVVGFHARRWADAFALCCRRLLGARTSSAKIEWKRRTTRLVVAPVPIDGERLGAEMEHPDTIRWSERHDELRAGRKLLVRVDRIDLSKNPLRGFLAFERLLERRPELAREVLFLALINPSRLGVEAYGRYYAECTGVVRRINERFGADVDDGPVVLHYEDDYHRSLGALRIYDVLLVNPVFDGLNLVAKEGPFANERDGVLILSENAGVFEEFRGDAAIAINPFDVAETADAIERAIEMPAADRRRSAAKLRRLATKTTPDAWARLQLRVAGVRG